MKNDFIISGIRQDEIQHLFSLDDQALKAQAISKITVDEKPGYPCRLSLEDADVGEEVLAFNYEHHKANSPYRSSGPVFVRFNVAEAVLKKNEIPQILTHRYLSLRTYDEQGMMIDAATIKGEGLENTIQEIFSNPKAAYIQVHNARPGCYNCQIDRVRAVV
ncbi:MAG: DUF1203 domain-containing protein [Bacteroidota bacterium]